ncbi:hypothetical protein M426DRAFT_69150, partial [Hypoxylon sp. CI-4A]
RTFNGAVVHFEAGAIVWKISLPSDFSAIQISGLPCGSTRESVLDLLRSRGLNPPTETHVRITRQLGPWSALVKVEDPEFAKLAGKKFGPQTTSGQSRGSEPVATPVEPPIPSDSNTLRVDCKKVHISWHKPYRTAWLNFGSEVIAMRVRARFRDGSYKVLGQDVECGPPTRGAGHHNPLAWSICLTEVPVSATESDLSGILPPRDKPRGIELGKPTYDADPEACSVEIWSLFTSIGPLEYWEFTPDTTGKRVKASARFQNEDDAREAERTLNNSPLPFNKNGRLTVQLVHTARFKVPVRIYETVQARIKANIKDWKAAHLYFTAYENSDTTKWYYRSLKVEGEDAKQVAAAKNKITSILAGIVAKDGASTLWHPAISRNSLLSERLKQLEQQYGIAIIPDRVKSQLRLYGPPAKCEEGQAAIASLLSNEKSERFEIDLEPHEFSWVVREGLKKLMDEVGSEKITFTIASTPKKIGIIGTVKDYEEVMSIIKTQEPTHDEAIIPNKQDCSVCWSEAEAPIRTKCQHVYCLDCFENLCLSAMKQDSTAKVCCVGDSGNCGTTLSLPELQHHLSSSTFEELLEQSFVSYIRLHPQTLRHCPTADCESLYRVSATSKMQTCPSCLVPVCTCCHAQHGAMTCADYKDLSTGGYAAFERAKKEIGIKDCPVCKSSLEKTEGCNHVTCRCGANICWICLRDFDLADECYDHMLQVHRGIGLEQLRDMGDFD